MRFEPFYLTYGKEAIELRLLYPSDRSDNTDSIKNLDMPRRLKISQAINKNVKKIQKSIMTHTEQIKSIQYNNEQFQLHCL
ncbi:hypothetical protein RIR_jg28464.t1 [Rhizophagus irregularis DAOM 181602=DAOM 197198]|uniref:Uncharacterized protein n=1 Tax=Rhizophagus irregularis (strain DAOM 181602 / DAOM 197198 / MUCL 43194) TaxID=747089 RepID=U9UNC0_RHIID|nr:hypothetical protein RIR_jg28464.t1 [Rhizophagus irregularis DAOM 181602=DAOM 197198]